MWIRCNLMNDDVLRRGDIMGKRYKMAGITFYDGLVVMVEIDEDESVMRKRALEEVRRIVNEDVEDVVDGVNIL